MKKIVLILSVVFALIPLVPPKETKAIVPVATRIVSGSVGERVFIGLMENSGVRFANYKARKEAVERLNKKLADDIESLNSSGDIDGAQRLSDFSFDLANADKKKLIPHPTKEGIGQFVLDSSMALLGLDMALDLGYDIKDHIEGAASFQTIVDVEKQLEEGTLVTSYQGYGVWWNPEKSRWYFGNTVTRTGFTIAGRAEAGDRVFADIKKVSDFYGSPKVFFDYYYTGYNQPDGTLFDSLEREYVDSSRTIEEFNNDYRDYQTIQYTPNETSMPEIEAPDWTKPLQPYKPNPNYDPNNPESPEMVPQPDLSPTEVPTIAPDWFPEQIVINVPEEMPNENPDGTIDPSQDPWKDPINDPIGDTTVIPTPVPNPNPNPDGTGTGTDTTHCGCRLDNPRDWDMWKPWVLLLPFLDLLIAIASYLFKLIEFVVSIPLISEKPIDNSAFVWFKHTKIMGVNIYSIVMSMMTIGLSLVVYKVIRRSF
jgi:hypothetical protein